MTAALTAILRDLIEPVHAGLKAEFGIPDTREAAGLSLAIKVQESGLTAIRDQGNDNIVGPATGMWQFERNGGVAEVLEEGKVAPIFLELCRRVGVNPERDPVWRLFVSPAGDDLACAAARLLIWKDPSNPPPLDLASSAAAYAYYKRRWRPGADREADWHAKSWPTALAVMQAAGAGSTTPAPTPVASAGPSEWEPRVAALEAALARVKAALPGA